MTPTAVLTDAQRTSWAELGYFRIGGFAPLEACAAMLQAERIHTHISDRRPGANYDYFEIVDHDMRSAEPVLMDPGDLLVFDSHLMHCSTDNESGGIRAAMVYHDAAAGTVDRTEDDFPSVNDWVPARRDGRPTEPAAA